MCALGVEMVVLWMYVVIYHTRIFFRGSSTIVGRGSTIVGCGSIIVGDDSTIVGDDSTIVGGRSPIVRILCRLIHHYFYGTRKRVGCCSGDGGGGASGNSGVGVRAGATRGVSSVARLPLVVALVTIIAVPLARRSIVASVSRWCLQRIRSRVRWSVTDGDRFAGPRKLIVIRIVIRWCLYDWGTTCS